MSTGNWYWISYSFNNATKAFHYRVLNANLTVFEDGSGTTTNNISVADAPGATFGRRADGNWAIDGRLDEIVVFNDILTSDERDDIAAGTYSYGSDVGSGNEHSFSF